MPGRVTLPRLADESTWILIKRNKVTVVWTLHIYIIMALYHLMKYGLKYRKKKGGKSTLSLVSLAVDGNWPKVQRLYGEKLGLCSPGRVTLLLHVVVIVMIFLRLHAISFTGSDRDSRDGNNASFQQISKTSRVSPR